MCIIRSLYAFRDYYFGHHNTGKIRVKPNPQKNEVIIIDGQQRITTTLILLAALRDQMPEY